MNSSMKLATMAAVVLTTAGGDTAWAEDGEASFEGLGFLSGNWSQSLALSADGSVVVGRSTSDTSDGEFSTDQAFRWHDGIMEGLGYLPVSPIRREASIAHDVSADGLVIVGLSVSMVGTSNPGGSGDHAPGPEAVRWEDGIMVGLGLLPDHIQADRPRFSQANGVSADGLVVVGSSGRRTGDQHSEAFRWENGSMVGLGFLSGYERSFGTGVSADGSVIVGGSADAVGGSGEEATRWENDSVVGLGFLPGDTRSWAADVSADGSVVVGFSGNATQMQAVRWEDGNIVGLGQLQGASHSGALAVNADGSTIGGWTLSDQGTQATIWDAAGGLRTMHDMLVDEFNVELGDWTLRQVTGISDDGNIIVGWGRNPDGFDEAWIARLAAQMFRWTNTDGGLFSEGENWEAPNPPGENDTAIIDQAGTYTITLDDNEATGGIEVAGAGVEATIDLAGFGYSVGALRASDGGALTITGGVTDAAEPVLVADGELTVQAGGAMLTANDALTVGRDGGGVLIVNDGGTADVTGLVTLGVDADDDGTITVIGANSILIAADGVIVGQVGQGLLTVRDGATAELSEHLKLGVESSAMGNVRVEDEDSEIELKGDLTIGDAGSGNVSVLNGGTFATKELEDENEDVIAEGKTKVGVQSGATGSIAVAGEDSAFTSAGGLTLGDEGNGMIEVSDGGAFTARDGAKFGAELGATGDASAVDEDSTLTVQGALTLGDAGAGRLLVGDGATASADAVTMGKQLNAIGELIVSGEMSVFEVEGALIAGGAGHADVLVEAGGRLESASLTIGTEVFVQNRVVTIEGGASLLHTGETIVGDEGNGSLVIRDGGRVETGIAPASPADATVGRGPFGDGDVVISGDSSQWVVGGALTVGDGAFGVVDVELGGQLTTAGGQLGATGNGGPGHVTVTNPDSRWDSSEAIVLAGTGFGNANPGPSTGQAILNILDRARVEAPAVTLGAGLAPGRLNVQTGGELIASDGITLRWGNMDADGPTTEVRSSDGALAIGNGSASFTNGARGSFDQVIVQAPLGGGNVSELIITDATIEATSTLDPAVIVGGEAGGLISMTNGLLDAEGGEVHIESNGTLAGTGTLRGNVTGSGTISPGLSPGTLTIEGDYTQNATGSLTLEIAGLTPSLAHDVLAITGDATFDGQIIFRFIDGFAPKMDDTFDLLDIGGALDLAAADLLVQNLLPGFEFDLVPTATGMQMLALSDGEYIPEPGSLTLLSLGTLILLRRRTV